MHIAARAFIIPLLLISVLAQTSLEASTNQRWSSRPNAVKAPSLSEWEQNNVDVYKNSGIGVVYITSIALQWDSFFNVVPQQGSGSGVIIDKQGNILTNYHVIADARQLEVTLVNNIRYQARVIGVDPSNDVAIIRISAPPSQLHPVPMGDSSTLQVGQKVLAIGNPFGLARTLTVGVVSALSRDLRAPDGKIIHGIIQTDAAINPGNSGGPLLDTAGRIVGINTAIFSPSGGSVGIGFTIPINRVRKFIPDLLTHGRPRHSWLGVHLFTLSPQLARFLDYPVKEGALIITVIPTSPAHNSQLRGGARSYRYGNTILSLGGDLVVRMDGKKIRSAEQLVDELDERAPGETIELEVIRASGQRKVFSVKLGIRPTDQY